MNLGVDPRDNIRTKQELMREKTNTINFVVMSIQQLLQLVKEAKSKRDRDKAVKAFLAKLLSSFKSICTRSVSVEKSAAISALGNGLDTAGDTALGGSAGDAAKSGVK